MGWLDDFPKFDSGKQWLFSRKEEFPRVKRKVRREVSGCIFKQHQTKKQTRGKKRRRISGNNCWKSNGV